MRPVRWLWALFAVVAVATIVTYWRLPAGETYHFDETGASGALSRAVTYLNYPVALAAILILLAVRRDRWAVLAAAACAVAAVPGVVRTSDLTARWVNAVPAVGVLLAAGLSLGVRTRPTETARGELGGDRWRRLLLALLAIWSVPWLVAAIGLYAQDLPPLGDVIRSAEPSPTDPSLPSVHRGLHDGLFGAQLAATALLLWRARLSVALSSYRSLLLVYGLMVTAQDGWNEQVHKRGWTDTKLPDVLRPRATWAWLGILLATALVTAARAVRDRRHATRHARWRNHAGGIPGARVAAPLVAVPPVRGPAPYRWFSAGAGETARGGRRRSTAGSERTGAGVERRGSLPRSSPPRATSHRT
jgi:hypothetical protein